jgi:hypothetical protein
MPRAVPAPRGARAGRRTAAAGLLAVPALLAGCTPQGLAGGVVDRAAKSVVVAALSGQYPAPQADAAADCVLAAATPAEREALARDVGTRAGTTTAANIRALAGRPATTACLAARRIAPIVI